MDEDEFNNFMQKVEDVNLLLGEMRSPDPSVADEARRRADTMLGASSACSAARRPGHQADRADDAPASASGDAVEGGLRCTKDRVVINQRAFDRIGGSDPAEMSKECFMAQVEKDAEDRARDRRERKQRSDALRRRATEAFRDKHFEKALSLYGKAIDETRDSVTLYENRALTCLKLELYRRAVEDCDAALRLDEDSLKALLYKAKALQKMEDKDNSGMCIKTALEKHPHHKDVINDYIGTWKQDAHP